MSKWDKEKERQRENGVQNGRGGWEADESKENKREGIGLTIHFF